MKLSKSKRINVIKVVASILGDDDWTNVDLVLKQFALPTTNQWPSGDKESYVIEMIGEASDEVLLELAQHFGVVEVEPESIPVDPEPLFWQEGKLRVFITHLNAQR